MRSRSLINNSYELMLVDETTGILTHQMFAKRGFKNKTFQMKNEEKFSTRLATQDELSLYLRLKCRQTFNWKITRIRGWVVVKPLIQVVFVFRQLHLFSFPFLTKDSERDSPVLLCSNLFIEWWKIGRWTMKWALQVKVIWRWLRLTADKRVDVLLANLTLANYIDHSTLLSYLLTGSKLRGFDQISSGLFFHSSGEHKQWLVNRRVIELLQHTRECW